MLVLTEKILPPRRPQIFNDYLAAEAENAARAKRVADDRWINRIIEALAGTLRRVGK